MTRHRVDGAAEPAKEPLSLFSRAVGGRRGLVLPRATTTAAHLCAAYPFAIQAGIGVAGAFLGRDRLTGGGFFFDLMEAYEAGVVQGPNLVVSGAGAYGKSAMVKSYVYRTAATTRSDRFVAVIDPKGEWIPLARTLGWAALQLRPGGTLRVNPLDPGPAAAHLPEAEQIAGRIAVASALLAISLGQVDLSAGEQRVVAVAVRHISRAGLGVPTLVDLREALAHPTQAMADALDTTLEDLAVRRRPLLDGCVMLVEHDLRGMCDGPTSVELDWATAGGVVVDLSALLTNRRALKLVLTAASGWLAGIMYGQPNRHKLNVIDEGWIALDDLAIVRYLQDQWRLGRQFGTANILITHAVADLASQVDGDKAQAKIAEGLLNTTSVRVWLHQNPEQVGRLLADMGLTGAEAQLLDRFAPFQALWKIGAHTALVDHVIAPWEWDFADTDRAMRHENDRYEAHDAGRGYGGS